MGTVIFGVDGLTFRVLHPLIQRGNMPHFQKLSEQGTELILESKYPPITPVAWMSLSTGLKPARHGVYDFWTYAQQPDRQTPPRPLVVTHRKGGKAIWNILSEYGKRVLVINVPVTYPPEPINGYMVSGYMTPDESTSFTYPEALKETIYRIVPDYTIDLSKEEMQSLEVTGNPHHLIDATLAMTERRIKLITGLMEQEHWDFCYVAFVGADRLQHPLWDDICTLEPKAIEYFHLLDYCLGRVLEQLGPDDCLFVVSDHGFQGASRSFEINEYLYSQGLLSLGPDLLQRRKRSQRFNQMKHMLNQTGLMEIARKVRRSMNTMAASRENFGDVSIPLSSDFDLANTKAYVPSHSSTPGGYADIFLENDFDAELLISLCANLKSQVDPQNGTPLVDALYTNEVFGHGPYAPSEPHLLILPKDGITFRMTVGNKYLWTDARMLHDPEKKCGVHHKDGVMYAYGRGIRKGFKAPNAEVYDLVPTVLHSMNLPLPDNLDGVVLHGLFDENKRGDQSSMGAPEESSDVVMRKLKKLQRT